MRRKQIRWQWLSAVIISLMIFSAPAFAGDLNPSGTTGPTMKTLDQITPTWDQVLPASERFKLVMGGAAVLDKETGLVWEKSPDTGTYTWDWSGNNARYYCNNKTVGGRKGWKLPAIQELASLIDLSVSSSNKLPSGHPFSNVQLSYYWLDTSTIYGTNAATFLYFGDGGTYDGYKAGAHFVWCVRGGQGNEAQ